MKKKFLILIMSFIFFGQLKVNAAVEPELIGSMTGSANLVNTATLVVYDQKFLTNLGADAFPSPSQSAYHLKKVRNIVTFRINQNTIDDCLMASFTSQIIVQIDRKDENGNPLTTLYKTLTIDYDNTSGVKYKERHSFEFDNSYWTKITITTAPNSTEADYVILETTTQIERYLDLDYTVIPTFNTGVVNNKPNSILVDWNAINGAEEYDLEWTWVDDYDDDGTALGASTIAYNFNDDATRVTIKDNSYHIPIVYERGYLICRVRAIGKTGYFFDHRVPGRWSSHNYGTHVYNSGGSSFTMTKDAFYLDESSGSAPFEHEPQLTWQYASTYAELGKRKEVISYFDGSLRNRQMVTKVNTDESSIVGEQIYDYQGRPAVNILPVPDLNDQSLNYHHNFNIASTSGLPYSKSDFDEGSGFCDRDVDPLHQSYGASKYYSDQNPLVNDIHNEYIPHAYGYPFTITEFTPDNTGRVRRQSGVGQEHKLASGHETKYYYAVPEQPELDRLFGNNVGDAAHYEKNMVIDPNGQVSISYLNAGGKVIATTLAGSSPSNLDTILNKTSAVNVVSDLLSGGNTWINENETHLYKTFQVSMQSDYTFAYSFNIPRHTDDSLPSLCFDCVYDLEISLKNECGDEMLDGNQGLTGNQAIVRTLGKPGSGFDVNCEEGGVTYSFTTDGNLSNQNITVNLGIGTYTLSKILKINKEALEYYTDQFLTQSTSIKTKEDFRTMYLNAIDDEGCEQTCSSCLEKIGTLEAFRTTHLNKLKDEEVTPNGNDSAQIEQTYYGLKEHCDQLCNQGEYSCNAYYQMLLADVSPGGQYAPYSLNEEDPSSDTYGGILGLVSVSNTIGFNYQYQWLNGTSYELEYTDNSNNPIKVSVNGEITSPNKLTQREFIRYFKPQWADFLVQYHPEYCKYQFCVSNEGSEQYNVNMLATQTYEAALDSGFLNPTNYSLVTAFSTGRGDPFWSESGSSKLLDIRAKMNAFYNPKSSSVDCRYLTIWEMPLTYYICPGKDNCIDLFNCINAVNWNTNSCKPYQDQMWQMYRALYMQEKNLLKESLAAYNCERTEHMSAKAVRFVSNQTVIDLVTDPTDGIVISSQLNDSINQHCDNVCEAQAEFWMKKLKPCNVNVTDSAALRLELINVCKNGCDQNTPFGTTTVPGGKTKRITSSYNSFQEVFDAFHAQNKLTFVAGVCDAKTISFPKDYYHNYSEFVQDTGCIVFADPNDNCARGEQNALLKMNFMTTIPQNDSLSCKKCINCEQLFEAVNYLQGLYEDNFFDTTYELKQLATQIINTYLNFNLTYDDYALFALQCRGSDTGDYYLAPLKYFFDSYYYTSNSSEGHQLISPISNHSLYANINKAPDNWEIPKNALSIEKPEVLLASINGFQPVGMSMPPINTFVNPCICNKLQEKFEYWVNLPPAQDPNNPDTALFNQFLSDSCWETTSSGAFDFFSVLKMCREAYKYSPKSSDLSYNSTWSSTQQNLLKAIAKTKPLVIPNCYACTDPPSDNKTFYHTIAADVPRGNYPEQINAKHAVPCDSLKSFIDSLAGLPGNENLMFNLTMYLYTNESQYYDEPKYNTIKDLFYARFPHTYKDTTLVSTADKIRAFFSRYKKCLIAAPVPLDGCCMEPSAEARRLLDVFNRMTQCKGIMGNHFVYSDWEAYDWLDDYYGSVLYNKPCSTAVTYVLDDFDMPTIQMSFVDTCGDTSNLVLSYTDNLYNEAYFGLITRFYDFKPVSRTNCDTNAHLFNVKIDQLDWSGNLMTTTLTGYAPKWKLLDTCNNDELKLCDKSIYQSIPYKSRCREKMEIMAEFHSEVAYKEYIDSIKHDFKTKYMLKCSESLQNETFSMTYPHQEYHYTLYYYDQAGNLVKTVPPAGVQIITSPTTLTQITTNRSGSGSPVLNDHVLGSQYYFNSLNQLTKQSTPDAGTSEFWYDNLGRLVVSRNAQQNKVSGNDDYSYTQYDALGRITEVGQVNTLTQMTVAIAFDPTDLDNFIQGGTKTEVTQTYYDVLKFTKTYNDFSQNNLRSRVVSTSYEDTYDGNDNTYDHAVHYNYDIHGNVSELLRENIDLVGINEDLKHTAYKYDLVSGNVNEVHYQKSKPDMFLHKYEYDADNRIVNVSSSINNIHWDKEASYFYYLHGPLKRTEIGELLVQGVDFAYSIHGWIKSVNSNTLMSNRDIGRDGESGGVNQNVALDVFGYSLSYYENDFKSIGEQNGSISPTNTSIAAASGSALSNSSPNLFNGNIRHMVTAIKPFLGSNGEPQAMSYKYDQLNRISEANAYNDLDVSNNNWGGAAVLDEYHAEYTYDPNGNITTLKRSGNNPSNYDMDDLSYNYNSGTNQLNHVSDLVAQLNYTEDIDNQNTNNYAYDKIGNLTKDESEGITQIEWTVYGKIKRIIKDNSANLKNTITFEYSPDGHRVSKKVEHKNALGSVLYTQTTYYSRDAQGNVMATYQMSHDTLTWKTSGIYGSSRVGEYHADKIIDIGGSKPSNPLSADEFEFDRGHKRYELSNHLGNVLVVVSDKRTMVCISGNQYYEADIVSAQDYYPFGMLMPGRTYSSEAYNWGFNGQEKDDEISGEGNSSTAEYWQYDSRLGRRWNIDPIVKPWESIYACYRNCPILLIDPTGEDVDLSKLSEEDKSEIKNKVNSEHEDYNKEFASLYKQLENDKTTVYTYINTHEKITAYEGGEMGTVKYGGKNNEKKDIILIKYTTDVPGFFDSETALFEESFHADQFRRGLWGFEEKSKGEYGTFGVDIFDEVEAKIWTHSNVGKGKPLGQNLKELKMARKSENKYAAYLLTKKAYSIFYEKSEDIVDNIMRANETKYTVEQILKEFDINGVLLSNNKFGRLPESKK